MLVIIAHHTHDSWIGWDGVGAPLAHLFGELTSLF
jgi:hypothetical protein